MSQPQTHAPLALGIDDAAIAIGVARSALYAIVARGELASFKLGRRRLILAAELNSYINRVAKAGAR